MEKISNRILTAAVVGCGGMGRHQARVLAGMPGFRLAAVCDLAPENVARVTGEMPAVSGYTNFAEMLSAERPDVLAVCTNNITHAPLTIEAARAGVRGVYCEKPMAVDLAEARTMVETCREHGAALLVNHQRRIAPDMLAARRLIKEGAIGEVTLIRGQCYGDVLSDGTHTVDSLMWLTGDRPIRWVLGQIHRLPPDPAETERSIGFHVKGGYRYGHPVESGATAIVQVQHGPRLEIFCGDMVASGTPYQDYEVVGSTGRIWRAGDSSRPNLFVQDDRAYEPSAASSEAPQVPAVPGRPGPWRAVETHGDGINPIEEGFRGLHRQVLEGGSHPLSGDIALRGFEVVMAIYESARLGQKLELPLLQDQFPLELMIRAGSGWLPAGPSNTHPAVSPRATSSGVKRL